MDEKLRELADRLGIATAYTDCGLKAACHEVSDETVRFFAGVLGYKAGSGEEIARSLRALDNRRWQTALEPVYVIPRSRKVFDVVVPENEIEGDFGLSVVSRQTGEKSEVSFVVVTLPERRTVGKKTYGRLEKSSLSAATRIKYSPSTLPNTGPAKSNRKTPWPPIMNSATKSAVGWPVSATVSFSK